MPSSTTAADQALQTRFGIFETGSSLRESAMPSQGPWGGHAQRDPVSRLELDRSVNGSIDNQAGG
jgi:hypothetical protein